MGLEFNFSLLFEKCDSASFSLKEEEEHSLGVSNALASIFVADLRCPAAEQSSTSTGVYGCTRSRV